VDRGGSPLPAFPTYKSTALFAYLVLNRDRVHARPVLANLFWPDSSESTARKCLRTELWRIRQLLDDEVANASELLICDTGGIGLSSRSGIWIDIAEFERRILPSLNQSGEELSEQEQGALCEAVELWRGELLEGLYEDWCLYHRERLNALYLAALRRLMRHSLARKQFSRTVVWACQLLAADPLQEQVHRDLMQCYWMMGNRPAALRQHSTLTKSLRRELDVEPMEETRKLFEAIRDGAPPPTSIQQGPQAGGLRTNGSGGEPSADSGSEQKPTVWVVRPRGMWSSRS
jgi:DNA-binding SARP family transcriptional activator